MKKFTLMAAALAAALSASQPTFAADQSDRGSERNAPANRGTTDDKTNATGAGANAQPAAGRTAADRTSPDAADKNMDQHFVREAAIDGQYEVQVAQLAQQRAQSQEVKQFADHLIRDHQQANQQLMQLAQSKGIDIPRQLDPVHQAKIEKFQKLQGRQFEKEWVYSQLAGHVVDVLKFRDASQELQDNDLKQFAAQTLPKLQQHLQQAERLAGWGPGGEARPAGATEHGTGAHDATPGATSGSRTGEAGSTGAGSTGSTGTGGTGTGTGGTSGGAGGRTPR